MNHCSLPRKDQLWSETTSLKDGWLSCGRSKLPTAYHALVGSSLGKNHGWSSRNGLDGSLSSVAILECSFKISQYLYCSFGNDLLGSDQCSHLCDRLGKESSFLSWCLSNSWCCSCFFWHQCNTDLWLWLYLALWYILGLNLMRQGFAPQQFVI